MNRITLEIPPDAAVFPPQLVWWLDGPAFTIVAGAALAAIIIFLLA